MTSFRHWCRRALRSGHAYAEVAWLHWREPEHFWVRQCLSIWFWGAVLPASIVALASITGRIALLAVRLYPAFALSICRRMRGLTTGWREAVAYACFCILAKFPTVLGQIKFHAGRWAGRPSSLIEYKLT